MIVDSSPETDLRPQLARAVLEKGWDLLELRSIQASLEDVFIDLVTEETVEELASDEDNQREGSS